MVLWNRWTSTDSTINDHVKQSFLVCGLCLFVLRIHCAVFSIQRHEPRPRDPLLIPGSVSLIRVPHFRVFQVFIAGFFVTFFLFPRPPRLPRWFFVMFTFDSDTAGFLFALRGWGSARVLFFTFFTPTPSLSPLFLGVLCSCCDFDYVGENLFSGRTSTRVFVRVSRIFLKKLSHHFFSYGIEK